MEICGFVIIVTLLMTLAVLRARNVIIYEEKRRDEILHEIEEREDVEEQQARIAAWRAAHPEPRPLAFDAREKFAKYEMRFKKR